MFGLGMGELLVILFVVLLLFGGNKLPQLGGALGKAMTNFKKGLREGQMDEDEDAEHEQNRKRISSDKKDNDRHS